MVEKPICMGWSNPLGNSTGAVLLVAVDTVDLSTDSSRRAAAYVVATTLCSLLAVGATGVFVTGL